MPEHAANEVLIDAGLDQYRGEAAPQVVGSASSNARALAGGF
jgi:hypothetical protein